MRAARSAASSPRGARTGGLPLSLVIARYFVYVLVSIVLLFAAVLTGFMMLVQLGVVYTADFAERNLPETLARLEAGEIEPADLPASYRWAVLDGSGDVMASDMPEEDWALAREAAQEGLAVVHYNGIGGALLQEAVELPNGDTCVLQYDYVPDFSSRALRDALPDPQTLLSIVLLVALVGAIALIAMRASRVIAGKMRPLADAAAHIERQELDFTVGTADVREVNDVLAAMERMRAALDESLRARWAADEARRRQVSALAHDLKTPLAVARWNADLLREGSLDDDQRASAEGLSDSIERMESYVRLLVETSQADAARAAWERVDVTRLAGEVRRQAGRLCEAGEVELAFACSADGAVRGDEVGLVRAAMNLVANAVEHAPRGSVVTVRFDGDDDALRIVVEDEGPGFSTAALEHAAERFFTECADRGSAAGHYGLGLSIVQDIAQAHGGSLEIANRENGGARCAIVIPRLCASAGQRDVPGEFA